MVLKTFTFEKILFFDSTDNSFGNTDSWNPGRTDIAVALGTAEKIPGKNKSAAKSKKKKIFYMRRILNPN